MIYVRIDKAQAAAALRRLDPAQFRQRLTGAIRSTLKDAKQDGSQLVKRRYTAKSPLSLGKISVRSAGLNGTMKVSGRRNLIKRFYLTPSTRPPHRPPGGLHVHIVRGSGGNLLHAFVNRAGVVFKNVGGRKLEHLSTISLAGMFKAVGEKVEEKMSQRLERRIEEAFSL